MVRGTLVEGMPGDPATNHVAVAFVNGQRVLVPVDALTLQADGKYYYLALRLDTLEEQGGDIHPTDQPYVVPVVEEVLGVERRRVETGRIRVH
jgi:hypothetical protein